MIRSICGGAGNVGLVGADGAGVILVGKIVVLLFDCIEVT